MQFHKFQAMHLGSKTHFYGKQISMKLIGNKGYHYLPANEPTIDQYLAEFVWIFSFSWDVLTADCIKINKSRSALSSKLNSSFFCLSLLES